MASYSYRSVQSVNTDLARIEGRLYVRTYDSAVRIFYFVAVQFSKLDARRAAPTGWRGTQWGANSITCSKLHLGLIAAACNWLILHPTINPSSLVMMKASMQFFLLRNMHSCEISYQNEDIISVLSASASLYVRTYSVWYTLPVVRYLRPYS